MKKISSLSDLGLHSDISHSFFFKPINSPAAAAAAATTTATTATTALSTVAPRTTKITVVGVGNVGMAIAQTILTQDLCDTLSLLDANPDKLRVDVLTYVAWKLSGFPAARVIGSGTNLDSSRFRFLIADHLEVNAQDVQAYMVGEHGDSSVALWSSITVAGVPVLSSLEKNQIAYEEEALERIRKVVVESAYEVIRLKGYTSWAIGYSAASLARTLLRDQRSIHPVSLIAKGFYGIPDDKEVFLSLPAQLGRSGVLGVTSVHLTEKEARCLQQSADTLWEIQQQLGI